MPTLQSAPGQVSFHQKTTALKALVAIGLATHTSIGVIPGQDTRSLCSQPFNFNLTDMDAQTALTSVARQIQYSMYEEDGVTILRATDLTARQEELLKFQFTEYPAQTKTTIYQAPARIAEGLWSSQHPGQGYGASIFGRSDAVTVDVPALKSVTAIAVANQFIIQGAGGMWISQIRPNAGEAINDYDFGMGLYQQPQMLVEEVTCAR